MNSHSSHSIRGIDLRRSISIPESPHFSHIQKHAEDSLILVKLLGSKQRSTIYNLSKYERENLPSAATRRLCIIFSTTRLFKSFRSEIKYFKAKERWTRGYVRQYSWRCRSPPSRGADSSILHSRSCNNPGSASWKECNIATKSPEASMYASDLIDLFQKDLIFPRSPEKNRLRGIKCLAEDFNMQNFAFLITAPLNSITPSWNRNRGISSRKLHLIWQYQNQFAYNSLSNINCYVAHGYPDMLYLNCRIFEAISFKGKDSELYLAALYSLKGSINNWRISDR